MSRQIVVDIVGDSSKFTAATKSATTSVGKFQGVAKGIGVGIGFGAIGLATTAISGVVDALGGASDAYKQDQDSQIRMKANLKNSIPAWDGNTDAIEAHILSLQKYGVADETARDALGDFATATGDAGESVELLDAAVKLAAAKNLTLEEASGLVTKAYFGNVRGLKSLGIELKKGAKGLDAIEELQGKVKTGADELADSESGKQAAAQLKLGETMERIGAITSKVATVILPILADAFEVLIDVISEVWTAIQPVVSAIASFLIPIFQKVATFISTVLVPAFRVGWTNIGNAFKTAAEVIGPIVTTLLGVFNTISTTIGTVATAVFTAIGKIIGFFTGIGGKIASAASGMWDGIWNAFRGVINFIIDAWNSLKFTLPEMDLGPLGKVGGWTIGTPNIPRMHTGGIVPGVPGSDVPAILQAGETVIPRGGGSASIHIHVGMLVGSDASAADALADLMVERLRTRGAF